LIFFATSSVSYVSAISTQSPVPSIFKAVNFERPHGEIVTNVRMIGRTVTRWTEGQPKDRTRDRREDRRRERKCRIPCIRMDARPVIGFIGVVKSILTNDVWSIGHLEHVWKRS